MPPVANKCRHLVPCIAAAILLLLPGCASRQFHQKAVALAAKYADRRAAPAEKADFAKLRSVSLLAGREVKMDRASERLTIGEMSEGQAACISEDGYLLTAAHVVERGSGVFVFVPKSRDASSWWKADPVPGTRYLVTNRAGRTRLVGKEKIMVIPIRVVRRFPGTDVALIHAEGFRPPVHFALAETPPSADATIWAHCAPSNGPPACVSGNVFSPLKSRLASFFVIPEHGTNGYAGSRREGTWRIVTSVVVQCGDSGGAGFDDQGRLVGVSSSGAITPGILGRPRPLWNAFDGVSAAKIRAAIKFDRSLRQLRITFPAKASSALPSAS